MTRIQELQAQLAAAHQQRMESDAEYRSMQMEWESEQEHDEPNYDCLVDQANQRYYECF